MRTRTQEILAGGFVALGVAALFFLALKVSGLVTVLAPTNTYELTAHFQNVGGLSKNAKVTMSGVPIGKVESIEIDPKMLNAKVTLQINSSMDQISDDAYASILTAGLLGEQYIGIEPGANDIYLQDGDELTLTQSALVLEDLISKFLFSKATEPSETSAESAQSNEASEPVVSEDDSGFAF